MNNVATANGDTIVRLLFGWRLETAPTDFGGVPGRAPFPVQVSLIYHPDPFPDVEGSVDSLGGAKLWREMVSWEPQQWTDGSSFTTRWYANSYGMRSIQAQRIIHDKTEAVLRLGWSSEPYFDGGEIINESNFVAVDITGVLQVEWLLLR